MELIRLENVEKIYQDNGIPVKAITNINLKFDQGEFAVIEGPSGSGKTTLLNVIGALDKPTTGKIFFEGEELSKKSQKELSIFRLHKIGFVFQTYNLIPVLTAFENIEFVMLLQKIQESERRKKALSIMKELGIDELADKKPNEMSGGQQQRVAIARAIVANPKLVLADEPTANLDSQNGSQLMSLMEDLNREKGITFIFASHDPLVINRARRNIILRDGKVLKDTSLK